MRHCKNCFSEKIVIFAPEYTADCGTKIVCHIIRIIGTLQLLEKRLQGVEKLEH